MQTNKAIQHVGKLSLRLGYVSLSDGYLASGTGIILDYIDKNLPTEWFRDHNRRKRSVAVAQRVGTISFHLAIRRNAETCRSFRWLILVEFPRWLNRRSFLCRVYTNSGTYFIFEYVANEAKADNAN